MGKKKQKDRHPGTNVGEAIKQAIADQFADYDYSGWQYREVTPGYWGLVSPTGVTFNQKFKDFEEVKAFMRQQDKKLKKGA